MRENIKSIFVTRNA